MKSILKGWAVWITGLPGSGKSTITKLLAEKLRQNKIPILIFSSDMLRKVLTPKPSYTDEERTILYGVLVFIAKLLTENGVNVLLDATGNRRRYRTMARKKIRRFMEAYIKCPLDICILREKRRKRIFGAPSKIYAKAFEGVSTTVPGFGAPYEEPINPEVTVESDRESSTECVEKIFEAMRLKFNF